jgi:hypothetical protein
MSSPPFGPVHQPCRSGVPSASRGGVNGGSAASSLTRSVTRAASSHRERRDPVRAGGGACKQRAAHHAVFTRRRIAGRSAGGPPHCATSAVAVAPGRPFARCRPCRRGRGPSSFRMWRGPHSGRLRLLCQFEVLLQRGSVCDANDFTSGSLRWWTVCGSPKHPCDGRAPSAACTHDRIARRKASTAIVVALALPVSSVGT